jgi:hypothetical protein
VFGRIPNSSVDLAESAAMLKMSVAKNEELALNRSAHHSRPMMCLRSAPPTMRSYFGFGIGEAVQVSQ